MRALSRWIIPAGLALAAAAVAPAASAAVADNTGEIELHAGWYFPDENIDESHDELVYGVRFGYNLAEHFGMQLDLSHFETDFDVPAPGFPGLPAGDYDYDQFMADLSFEWQINPDDRAVFQVYGGPGYAWTDVDGPGSFKADGDDFWSLHAGAGVQIGITDRFYVRPDVRARWFDTDGDDNNAFRDDTSVDWQGTVAIGWYLGGNVGAAAGE
jgi:hypothetical protein